MNGTPLNNSSPFTDPFAGIGDEVQEELDRHAAFLRASGTTYSPPAPQYGYSSEIGAVMGALLGPFVYSVLVLVCQYVSAPELFHDSQYKLLLLGSLPYALMWGSYLGARLPAVVLAARWRSLGAWLGLTVCLGTMALVGSVSPVAHLYMPLYALPFASIIWVELAARSSK